MLRMKSILILAAALLVSPAMAQNQDVEEFAFGGDNYVAGQQAIITVPVTNDAFAAGYNVRLDSPIAGDAHAAGYDVNISANVGDSIYAAGNTVSISGAVGDDVTAFGASVSITGGAAVEGNVRAAGGTVTLSKPVNGSALLAGGSVAITSTIGGDLLVNSEIVTFADGARVDGTVTIRTSADDMTVPASVAPASRVTIEKVEPHELGTGPAEIAQESAKRFWPLWLPMLMMPVIGFVIGVIWLALFPKRSLIAYNTAMAKPFKSLGFGILALAAFIGLIPVVAMTVIGIPLVPIAVIVLVIAWIIGCIAGVWFLATRILAAFGFDHESMGKRVVALIVGIILGIVLGMIPFLGWLIQLVLIWLGLGGITHAALGRWLDSDFHKAMAEEVKQAAS